MRTTVGIDPDTAKSGVAIINPDQSLRLCSLTFPQLIELFQLYADRDPNDRPLIVIESSWLTTHNWHGRYGDSHRVSATKGYDVGRCHETGRKLVEVVRHYGLEVIEQKPLRKRWHGKEGKITHEELAHLIPNLPHRTNQDQRDALLIAWVNK